jgi:hypothetical protein
MISAPMEVSLAPSSLQGNGVTRNEATRPAREPAPSGNCFRDIIDSLDMALSLPKLGLHFDLVRNPERFEAAARKAQQRSGGTSLRRTNKAHKPCRCSGGQRATLQSRQSRKRVVLCPDCGCQMLPDIALTATVGEGECRALLRVRLRIPRRSGSGQLVPCLPAAKRAMFSGNHKG